MIIFALLLFLFHLVIWGSLLAFSVAAGVAASPRRIVLYTVLALMPVSLSCWRIPVLMEALILPVHSVSDLLLCCFIVYLVIHGLTRLFVYLYNH